MTNYPERSVEEIVKLNRTCGCTLGWCKECLKWKGVIKLTLQAERQRCEEMVEAERERIEKIEPPVKLMQDGVSNDWSYREGFQDAIQQVIKTL